MVHVVVGVAARAVVAAGEHPQDTGHLEEREDRGDPDGNGEGRIRPRDQKTERRHETPSRGRPLAEQTRLPRTRLET